MLGIDEIKSNRKEKRLLTQPRAGSWKRIIKQKKKMDRFVGAKMQINNLKRVNNYLK